MKGQRLKPCGNTLELVTRMVIVACGGLLVGCMVALYWQMIHVSKETERNREIACISRFIDGQQYAPQCEPYVRHFEDRR